MTGCAARHFRLKSLLAAAAFAFAAAQVSLAGDDGEEIAFAGGFTPSVEEVVYEPAYVGAAASMIIPQGGSHLRRRGGAVVRGGYYPSEFWAVELEVGQLEDTALLAAGGLWHWWGYERLDPFFTFGVRGEIEGFVGPKVGFGTFYHLSDSFSLRFDADATLDLDGDTEMAYVLSLGIQYSF